MSCHMLKSHFLNKIIFFTVASVRMHKHKIFISFIQNIYMNVGFVEQLKDINTVKEGHVTLFFQTYQIFSQHSRLNSPA